MQLEVLLWILAGGFAGTWGLVLYFINRVDQQLISFQADARDHRNEIREHRKETNILIEAIRNDIKAIQEEMKDFHGRLCAIEQRNKSK